MASKFRCFLGQDHRINVRQLRTSVLALVLALCSQAGANPFPPNWGSGDADEANGPIHFAPAVWPNEPSNPKDCGIECGEWKPYTRFQGDINDPRVQDPSNGGTAPQNYVNISSSCIDKTYPSIYYYLKKGATEADDVIMFRWRVEQIANNYATGPSAGSYGATDPWSSGLWTVLFDMDGDGYRDLAAHLNGSSGAPSSQVDMIAGVWGNIPTQSVDYLNDPEHIKVIAHNPTAFIGNTGKILNFHDGLSPNESWPNGSSETIWDYGTSRAKLVYTNSCNEYFVDYQIPVRMLDASSSGPNPGLNGPKITRSTPISMLFCTANSLNNPFQKDCALDRSYVGDSGKPGPFGDYLSFDREEPYAQPIVSSVTATAPIGCSAPTYELTAKVQDTLYVNDQGEIQPSIQSVQFFYWYDKNGNGIADAFDAGSSWTYVTDGIIKPGSLNTWTASWNASGLLKGRYLIGVQAVDDKTLHDDGAPDAPINNRVFSYIVGSTDAGSQAQIYNNDWSWDGLLNQWLQNEGEPPADGLPGWLPGQDALFPAHAASMQPDDLEDWYGNPDATGLQIATAGVDIAINSCGVAPSLNKTASQPLVNQGDQITFTLHLTNPSQNTTDLTVTQIQDDLPSGFSYVLGSTSGDFGSSDPTDSANRLSWLISYTLHPGESATLSFNALANVPGTYNNTANFSSLEFGLTTSPPAQVTVGEPRLTLSKVPTVNDLPTYSVVPGTQITYVLTYANDSAVNTSGLTLTDVLPSGISYVAGSCTGGCQFNSGTLSWGLADLAAGEGPYSLSYTVQVDDPYVGQPTLHNLATLDSAETTPVSDSADVYVDTPRALLSMTKVANKPLVQPGVTTNDSTATPANQVVFTLTYKNGGNATAHNLVLQDQLPPGFSYVTATGSPSVNGTLLTWNVLSLDAGQSGSVSVTALVSNPYTQLSNPATNSATLSSTETAPITDSADVGIKQSSQLCAVYYMTDQPGANDRLNKDMRLSTSGLTAGDMPITADNLFNSTTYVQLARFFQEGVAPGTTVFRDSSGVLQASVSLTGNAYVTKTGTTNMDFKMEVYDFNPIDSSQTLIAASTDVPFNGNSGNNTFTLTVVTNLGQPSQLQKDHQLMAVLSGKIANNGSTGASVRVNDSPKSATSGYVEVCSLPPANLVLEKSVDQGMLDAVGSGRVLSYTLNYANTSSVTAATNVVITDTLPVGVNFLGATLNGGPVSCAGANPYSCDLGTVAGSASGALVIQASVDDDLGSITSLTNSATLHSDQTAPVTATATTLVSGPPINPSGSPNILVFKQVSQTGLVPGDSVTYTLTLVNAGDAIASNVQVQDTIPAQPYFSYVPLSINGGDGSSDLGNPQLTWSINSMVPGSTRVLSFDMQVADDGSVPDGLTVLDNSAALTYDGGVDFGKVANSNTVSVTINTNPELTLAKSVYQTNVPAQTGDELIYQISVRNVGSSTATLVQVNDPILAYTSYVQGSLKVNSFNMSDAEGDDEAYFDAMDNQVVFPLGSMQAGVTADLEFRVRIADILPAGFTQLNNIATVSASNAASRTASAATTAYAQPVLTVSKAGPTSIPYPAARLTADASSTTLFVDTTAHFSTGQMISVGGVVGTIQSMGGRSLLLDTVVNAPSGTDIVAVSIYNISYQNLGDATAANAMLTDDLPQELSFVQASDNGIHNGGTPDSVTWSLGDIAPGASGTVQIAVLANQSGSTTNIATLESDDTAPVSDPVDVEIGGLSVDKVTTTPISYAGGQAIWTITIRNSLPSDVLGVSVADILPSGFTYNSTSNIVETGATRTLTQDPLIGDIQPNWGTWTLHGLGSLSITFVADIGSQVGAATYQNGAELTASGNVGIVPFDPLATTAEDVTILAAGTGMIEGTLYMDLDEDGVLGSPGDVPLAGTPVTIIDALGTAYVVYTNADGYFVRIVAAGQAIVDVADPVGAMLTTDSSNQGSDPTSVNVPNLGMATDNTGYVTAPAGLGNIDGRVFDDMNLDGLLDPSEIGHVGVLVELLNLNNAVLRSTYTGVLGEYAFNSLTPDIYRVRVTIPTGFGATSQNPVSGVSVVANTSTTVNFGLGVVPDLMVTKTHNGQFLQGATGATYTLVVTNVGSIATNGVVTITDFLPSGLSATNLQGANWNCTLIPLSCSRSDPLVPGASFEPMTLTVDIANNAASPVINVVQVSGGGEVNTGNNSDDDIAALVPTYSISGEVFLDLDGSGLKNGAELGIDAGGLFAVLADGSGLTVARGQVAANGGFTLADIADGSYSLRISMTDGLVGQIAPLPSLPIGFVNTGDSIDGSSTDGLVDGNLSVVIASANVAGLTFGIQQQADLAVSKTDGLATIESGSDTTYSITVQNLGPGGASGAVLVDPAVSGLNKLSVSCVSQTGGAQCPAVTINALEAGLVIPVLPAGGELGFSVVARVTASAGSQITNTVTITPPQGVVDPVPGNDSASDTDEVVAPPVNTYSVSGTLFLDDNSNGLLDVGESGTQVGGLHAVLVDANGLVIGSMPIGPGGLFGFAGLISNNYLMLISTSAGAPGQVAPNAGLPAGFANTGESLGLGSTDGQIDGRLGFVIAAADLNGLTFGIRQDLNGVNAVPVLSVAAQWLLGMLLLGGGMVGLRRRC